MHLAGLMLTVLPLTRLLLGRRACTPEPREADPGPGARPGRDREAEALSWRASGRVAHQSAGAQLWVGLPPSRKASGTRVSGGRRALQAPPPPGGTRLPDRPRPRPGPASCLPPRDWKRTPPSPPTPRPVPLHLPLPSQQPAAQPPLTLGARSLRGSPAPPTGVEQFQDSNPLHTERWEKLASNSSAGIHTQ